MTPEQEALLKDNNELLKGIKAMLDKHSDEWKEFKENNDFDPSADIGCP